MNLKDIYDIDIHMMRREWCPDEDTKRKQRELDIFFNKCLRTINGEDAYKYLCNKVGEILGVEKHYTWCSPVYGIVNYFFDNNLQKEMSLEDWLYSDDGPVVFSLFDMPKIFPEFKLLAKNEHGIVELANERYDLDLIIDDDYVYSLSFNWNSFEPIPIEEIRKKIMEVL